MKMDEISLTNRLLQHALDHRERYAVDVLGNNIAVFPGVFPPVSPFSYDSLLLAEANDTRPGEKVLDIGTGTGVHSVISAKKGARKVVATDISQKAVENVLYNVANHGLKGVIDVRKGDLFEPLEEDERFDLIIANLPFVDHPVDQVYEHWVYDPGYVSHRGFFGGVHNHMYSDSRIMMAFADLGDVVFFEDQILTNHLIIKQKTFNRTADITWLVYKLVGVRQ